MNRLHPLQCAAFVLFAATGCVTSNAESAAPVDLRYEIASLEQTRVTLSHGNSPDQWDATGFVSARALKQAVKALEGISAGIDGLDAATIQLQEVRSHFGAGLAELRIVLKVSISENMSLTAPIRAYLEYSHSENEGSSGRATAVFRVRLSRGKVVYAWGPLEIRPPDALVATVTSFLEQKKPHRPFLEGLTVRIPLQIDPVIRLGDTRPLTYRYNHNSADATVAMSIPQSELRSPLSFQPPVITSDGVWMFARLAPAPLLAAPKSAETTANLEQQRDALERTLRPLIAGMPVPDADSALWLKDSVFAGMVESWNQLPDKQRMIRFSSTKRHGSIAEKWHHIAGQEGGYSLSFARDDAFHAAVQIGSISQTWVDDRGATFSFEAKAHADLDLELIVDPFVGGGVSTQFTLRGDAARMLRLTLFAEKLVLQNTEILALGPVLTCDNVPIELRAGGALRFGANIKQAIGKEPQAPQILVTSQPSYLALTSTKASGLVFSEQWLEVTVHPKSVRTRSHVYEFLADFSVRRVAEQPDPGAMEANRREMEKALESEWKQRHAGTCSEDSDVEFVVGDIPFGPNNEIVKFLKQVYETAAAALEKTKEIAERTNQNFKVAYHRLESVVKNPKNANKVVSDIVRDIREERSKFNRKIEKVPVVREAYHVIRSVGHALGL